MTVTVLATIVLLALGLHPRAQVDPAPRVRHDVQPVESALTYHSPDYHAALRRLLFDKAPAKFEVRMLVSPSFEPELLLTLHRGDFGWRAHVVRPPESVWGALQEQRALEAEKCTVHERVMSAALGSRIAEATLRMLERTRHEATDRFSTDGTTHTFFGWRQGFGRMSGTTHEPAPGTRARLLTDVADACVAYVLADDAAAKTALAAVEAAVSKLEKALAAVAAPQQSPR